MRCTTSLAMAALALALPFILAHCASLQSTPQPLTYDAKSVGKPNSGAPLELWLPPGTGPFPAVLVMHGCAGVRDHHRGWARRLTEWGYAAALLDSFRPRNVNATCFNKMSSPRPSLRAQDAFNQIEKAYGPNNFILDNCHVRVSFATNDERTAKRVSDALGTATEIRDARNYAGHRLSPWLGHLMVSRQEAARPLLTPGEVMQLPATDELVLVSGCPPIRARKARYYEDRRLTERLLPPPKSERPTAVSTALDDWSGAPAPASRDGGEGAAGFPAVHPIDDAANGGIRREPELAEHEDIAPEPPTPSPEFAFGEDEPDEDAVRARALRAAARGLARQAALDPGDGIDL